MQDMLPIIPPRDFASFGRAGFGAPSAAWMCQVYSLGGPLARPVTGCCFSPRERISCRHCLVCVINGWFVEVCHARARRVDDNLDEIRRQSSSLDMGWIFDSNEPF